MSEGYYRAEDVRAAARGQWESILGKFMDASLLSNKHGPCPGCGGRDRFRFDDKDGEGSFICSQGGGGNLAGDGINLLEHVTGKDWKECVNLVGELLACAKRQGKAPDQGVAKRPERVRESWVPDYDEARLRNAVKAVPAVSAEWFMERSPVDVRGLTSGDFLERIFLPGERVIVFTRFKSQGDFLWEVGRGGFRLADERGVKATRSALPSDGGRDGMWYLCNPVDGQWYVNPRQGGKYSRRSEESVTAWRHLVLENDVAKKLREQARDARLGGRKDEAKALDERAREAVGLWFRFLGMVPMAVKAIYSSGGDSWHALVRVDQADKASFDGLLRGGEGLGAGVKRVLPAFGADPGAMSGVRLTRLPGCTRRGVLQRLVYLNPDPAMKEVVPIWTMPRLREVK
jgi:hypothetical protein